jgi:hypothetical protein
MPPGTPSRSILLRIPIPLLLSISILLSVSLLLSLLLSPSPSSVVAEVRMQADISERPRTIPVSGSSHDQQGNIGNDIEHNEDNFK